MTDINPTVDKSLFKDNYHADVGTYIPTKDEGQIIEPVGFKRGQSPFYQHIDEIGFVYIDVDKDTEPKTEG